MTVKSIFVASSVVAAAALVSGSADATQPPWHVQTVQMCVQKITGHTGTVTLEDVRMDKAEKVIEDGGFFYYAPAYNPDCTLGPIWDLCVYQLDLWGNPIGYDEAGIDLSGNLIGIRADGSTYVTYPMLITYCPE